MRKYAVLAAPLLHFVSSVAHAQTGHRVNVNGMRMYYEVSGSGVPLVVLHGAYMNIPEMAPIITKLARTHRVYAPELQGHGRTTDIDRPITYQNLADDVAAFMNEVGLPKADVFGYSMGAISGLQLAIRHPREGEEARVRGRRVRFRGVATGVQGGDPQADRRADAPDALRERVPQTGCQSQRVSRARQEGNCASERTDGLEERREGAEGAIITQTDLLQSLIDPFLKGVTPNSFLQP